MTATAQTLERTVDVMGLLADPTRVRLLALLARQELSVVEIVAVTELPQSRVSTHLGKLREGGLVRDRRDGTLSFYALADGMAEDARRIWQVVEGGLSDRLLESDRARAEAAVKARSGGRWPDDLAGEMERHYSPGRTWDALARAFAGLVRLGDVADVGCGDGAVAELLRERARSYTCVDQSERMVAAARARLGEGARVVSGDAAALPLADGAFDQVLLLQVLQHVGEPARALAEAARVLRPGGAVAITTLDAHDHAETAARYGHAHLGFKPAAVRRMCQKAGLEVVSAAVTSREKREPRLAVVTAFANKPED